jgi:hypothetical protein
MKNIDWKAVVITTAAIFGLMVSLTALGMTPWVPKSAANAYALKEDNDNAHARIEKQLDYLIQKIDRIYPEGER